MIRLVVQRSSFSLVELVVVVVIIGIIAAIAVPRISRGARSASESALRGSLRNLRSAIDLYDADHGGALPATDGNEDTFIDQLTKRTNFAGEVGTTAGEHIFGPYLRSVPPIPVGPNAGATGVECKNDDPRKVYENKTDKGWIYNYETGDFFANTDDLDHSGMEYDTY